MKEIFKSITKAEWLTVFGLSLLMIFITTLPLIYGWLITPPDKIFTGIHFAALNDWFVYYSYLEQVRQGHFLFSDLFSSQPGLAVLNPFWLGVGLFAKIFGLSNLLAFNLIRIILIPVFYFVAYLFLAYLFSETKKRKISLLLLSFSGGLGFFLFNQIIKYPYNFSDGRFNWPMDLWVPEFDTFLTLYYSPHFIASLILILLVFLLTAIFAEKEKLLYGVWSGFAALVLFSFHPFHILTIFAVILVYLIYLMLVQKKWFWSYFWYYFILAAISAPSIIYYLYLLKFDWLTSQKALQNLCFTTPFWLTVVSYGLILLFGILGIYNLFKEKLIFKKGLSKRLTLVFVWALVSFCLIYFPVNFQRRLTEGLHFPLVVLATIGLFVVCQIIFSQKSKLSKFLFSQRYVVLFFIVTLFIISNIFILATDLFIYADSRPWAYLDTGLIKAAGWLKAVDGDKVVFNSAENVINVIPAYSGKRVYVGHGVETPNFKQKQEEVNWFFTKNRSLDIEQSFLSKRNINYLIYGPAEKEIGNYQPEIKPYLKEVYRNEQVIVYQVL
ncbi:MAG: hypothetical protein WCW26_00425 [Candidatus Buchananbacteria bacterium]